MKTLKLTKGRVTVRRKGCLSNGCVSLMCFYKIRELFLAEHKDSFPWKRGGKEALEAAEASLAQQVPGSLNDENMGTGGQTIWAMVGWKQIIKWLKYGRKISKREFRGQEELWT